MSEPTSAAGAVDVEVPAADAAAFCKEQYEELLAYERQNGTMRARVIWQPATTVVAIVSLVLSIGTNATSPIRLSPMIPVIGIAVMTAVMVLIALIDGYFLREQRVLRRMARLCERQWLAAIAPKPADAAPAMVRIASFAALRRLAEADLRARGSRPDYSHVLLIVYLALISSIPLAIVLVPYFDGSDDPALAAICAFEELFLQRVCE